MSGGCARGFHLVFEGVVNLAYTTIFPALPTPLAITACTWGLAALLILPQSMRLGMTFPLLSGGCVRRFPERPGAALVVVYFANGLGGTIDVLTSGFVLIRLQGLPYTMAVAGLINLGLAGLGWGLGGGASEPRERSLWSTCPTPHPRSPPACSWSSCSTPGWRRSSSA